MDEHVLGDVITTSTDLLEQALEDTSVGEFLQQAGQHRTTTSVIVEHDSTLGEVLTALVMSCTGAAIVSGDGVSVNGIITKRDISGLRSLPMVATVSRYMTRHVETLPHDASLWYLVDRLAVRGYRNVPVTDQGQLQGIINIGDFLPFFARFGSCELFETSLGDLFRTRGGDILPARTGLTVSAQSTFSEALELRQRHNGDEIVVVDDCHAPVGILVDTDILVAHLSRTDFDVPVTTVATPEVTTVTPNHSVRAGVELMMERGIRHLPMVDEDGSLLGVIEIRDIVGLVRDRYLRQILCLPEHPHGLNWRGTDGA